jgi:hypothetical protein
MLIINGHKSHYSVDFQDYYKEKKIIALCILTYSLHLLQPLDIACFLPLKHVYSDGISALVHNHIHYISKETFLLAFKAAYKQIFIKDNAYVGF